MRNSFVVIFVTALALGLPFVPGAAAQESAHVWVSYTPGKKDVVKQAVLAAGGQITYESDAVEALAAVVPSGGVEALSSQADVAYVEDDPIRSLDGESIPWGIQAVQAPEVWDADGDGAFDAGAPRGAGRLVCIIDTGLRADHPDLDRAHVVGGVSLVPGLPWDEDYVGHGTHVAGIIAARLNGIGTVGIAPDVSLYVVRAAADLSLSSSILLAAVEACDAAGADVINMSLGGPLASRTEDRFFQKLAAKGVLMVAAAGNDGSSYFHYPGSYDSVISVAAIDESRARASFSQMNDAVELTAPGVAILSAFPRTVNNLMLVDGVELRGQDALTWGLSFPKGVTEGRLEWGGNCTRGGNFIGAVVVCRNQSYGGNDDAKVWTMFGSGATGIIFMGGPGVTRDVYFPMPIIAASGLDAKTLVHDHLAKTITLDTSESPDPGYFTWNGTSFSTPHAAGVAALIWSQYPNKTAAKVREALSATALDLGEPGRDPAFGYGLVQAKAALDYLASH